MHQLYDLIIVGGGLAGLAAAHELKGQRILLLEKEAKIGGRVLTKEQHGIKYDLGGLFAPRQEIIPIVLSHLISTDFVEEMGICLNNNLFLGKKVTECLNQVAFSATEKKHIRAYFQDSRTGLADLSKKAIKVLNAFFQLIHPETITKYVPQRKYDALLKYQLRFLEQGNGQITDFLAINSDAKILVNTIVSLVKKEGNLVKVQYQIEGKEQEVSAKKVLITTPAPITKDILKTKNKATKDFLNHIQFAGGFSLMLAFSQQKLKQFSYIATPDLPFNAVFQQRKNQEVAILNIYFTGAIVKEIRQKSRLTLIKEVVENLQFASKDSISPEEVLFHDAKYWEHIGPLINEGYEYWNNRALKPAKNIYLAGDYTEYNFIDPMPYGMTAAYLSGQRAARWIKQDSQQGLFNNYEQQYLLNTKIYYLDKEKPIYIRQQSEGDIAYYGLLLKANPSKSIQEYLLNASRGNLWEYQKGFGVTCEDSILVLDGLLASGIHKSVLQPSFEALIRYFYKASDGAFHTLSPEKRADSICAKGRASYWNGPSVDATAHTACLLMQYGEVYRGIIENCQQYIAKKQSPLGFWRSKWFPTQNWSAYYSIQLLLANKEKFSKEIRLAKKYLINTQEVDGSWKQSILETVFAIAALKLLGYKKHDYVLAGKNWLAEQLEHHTTAGETYLFYWYEENGKKLFHQCNDKGQLSKALIQWVLATSPLEANSTNETTLKVLI